VLDRSSIRDLKKAICPPYLNTQGILYVNIYKNKCSIEHGSKLPSIGIESTI